MFCNGFNSGDQKTPETWTLIMNYFKGEVSGLNKTSK